jgi:hypothetical protein
LGDNSRITDALNQTFGTTQPAPTPENLAIVRAQLLINMTRDVRGLVNAIHHKNPDHKAEVLDVINGPEISAEIGAAATAFLETLGTESTVGVE